VARVWQIRRDKQFDRGIGQITVPNIPAIQHRTMLASSKIALECQQGFAHLWNGRNGGGRLPTRSVRNAALFNSFADFTARRHRRFHVVKVFYSPPAVLNATAR